MYRLLIGLLFIFSLISCGTPKQSLMPLINFEDTLPLSKLSGGSSGMTQLDDQSYLLVYDYKNFEKGPRLGILRTYTDSIAVTPVLIDDWKDEGGIASDLEAVCPVPGANNEFLITESGNWQGKLGRVFHILLSDNQEKATVLGVFKIPMKHENNIGLTGDQYEAIQCLNVGGEIILLMGERGGSAVNPEGRLYSAKLDFVSYALTFLNDGIDILAPGAWDDASPKRDITDFYIDEEGILWTAASQDFGDTGPFRSMIYQIAKIDMKTGTLDLIINGKAIEVPGFKIEALSGPSAAAPYGQMSFGTEDEIYGGAWRIIQIN